MTKLFLVLVFLTLSFQNASAKENLSVFETFGKALANKQIATSGFADVIEELLPAVVNISTTQEIESKRTVKFKELFGNVPPGHMFREFEDLFEERSKSKKRKVSSLGSGFVISADGYIVTNYHVVEDADEIEITLSDSNKFKATIIGGDKKTDLALLKIDADYKLKYVKFGDNSKSRIGEWVIAVGNPFGLGGSVSVGIISAHGRDINSGQYDDFIQTDAAINKGNSGGPLFNMRGEVIGIATAIFSPSGGNVGIGFATPATTATPIIEQLKNHGEVTRGWLGVLIQNVSDDMASSIGMGKAKGAFIAKVMEDGPAAKAGILATDIIIKFDGKQINEMKDLPKMVAATTINKEVQIIVLRQGKEKTLITKIRKMKRDPSQVEAKKDEIKEPSQEASSYLLEIGLVEEDNEIVIVDVKEDSSADEKGIEIGDVILSANQIPVKTIADLSKIIEESKMGKKEKIFLFIKRQEMEEETESEVELENKSISFAVILPIKPKNDN